MSTIGQSDLRVKMKQKRLKSQNLYEVLIKTDNDDESRSPHLIFSLPRNTKVDKIIFGRGFGKTPYQIYGDASQAIPRGTKQVDGYVKFDFRNLKNEIVRIRIYTSPVGKGWKKGYGASAFVFSLTPEMNKENNFYYLPL